MLASIKSFIFYCPYLFSIIILNYYKNTLLIHTIIIKISRDIYYGLLISSIKEMVKDKFIIKIKIEKSVFIYFL